MVIFSWLQRESVNKKMRQGTCLPFFLNYYRGNLSVRKWAKAPACLFVLKFKKMRPDVPCAFLKFKKMRPDVPCAFLKFKKMRLEMPGAFLNF